MVGVATGEDLGLILQSAEGARVKDAVAVPLIITPERMRRLGIAAALRLFNSHGVSSQAVRSLAAHR
jgi:hypothetical protein